MRVEARVKDVEGRSVSERRGEEPECRRTTTEISTILRTAGPTPRVRVIRFSQHWQCTLGFDTPVGIVERVLVGGRGSVVAVTVMIACRVSKPSVHCLLGKANDANPGS